MSICMNDNCGKTMPGSTSAYCSDECFTAAHQKATERRLYDLEMLVMNDQNIYNKLSRGFLGRIRWLLTGE